MARYNVPLWIVVEADDKENAEEQVYTAIEGHPQWPWSREECAIGEIEPVWEEMPKG